MVKIMRKEEAVHRNQFIKKRGIVIQNNDYEKRFHVFFFAKIKFIINLLHVVFLFIFRKSCTQLREIDNKKIITFHIYLFPIY